MKKESNETSDRSGARPIWRGFLKFGLVSIPVRAVSARTKEGGDPDMHWLHASCHSRIHYKKVCPIHGEVADDEIVSGYEYSKKNYVVFTKDELKTLRTQRDDTIEVKAVVAPDVIDRIYDTDKSYYLAPDGKAGQPAYEVFQQALAEQDRYGVAEVILFKREFVVIVRSVDGILAMTCLTYPDHLVDADSVRSQLTNVKTAGTELKLAKSLLDQLSEEPFDFTASKDPYSDNMRQLVEAKIKGHKIVVPPEEKAPVSLDFMAALKKSLRQNQKTPPMAHSGHQANTRRKKSVLNSIT